MLSFFAEIPKNKPKNNPSTLNTTPDNIVICAAAFELCVHFFVGRVVGVVDFDACQRGEFSVDIKRTLVRAVRNVFAPVIYVENSDIGA